MRRRPSGHDDCDSNEDRGQEEPSTPILETSAFGEQYKPEEAAGGGEWSVVEADEDEDAKISI